MISETQIRGRMEATAAAAQHLIPDLNHENTARRESARAAHDAYMAEFDLLEKELEKMTKPELADVAERTDPTNSADYGERAEVRELMRRSSLADYVRAANNRSIIQGAPAELNSAFGIPVGLTTLMPIHMLLDERAATTTTQLDGPEMQRPILPRLFEGGLAEFLGVRMDSVGHGESEWPLMASGATAATVAEAAKAADPAAATFTTTKLKPKRYTTSLWFTYEMLANIGMGLEPALRMDMRNALMDLQNDALLSGSGTAPQGTGLETRLARPVLPSSVVSYTDVGGIPAKAVDAIHASHPNQVRVLIGLKTLEKLESEYRQGVGENAFEVLQRRSGGVRVSAKVNPPVTDDDQDSHYNGQDVFLYAAGGMMRTGDSVCAMWPTVELTRDNVTDAASGTVRLTLSVLMDFYMALREGAYKRLTLKLA